MSRKLHTPRTEGIHKHMWVEFTQLAAKYDVVNLGHGSPDFPPPSFAKEALCSAINEGNSIHQYTSIFGHPPLVKILAKLFGRILGREINPNQDILVTVGAHEALFCAIWGLIAEGDEVIIMEPFCDCYTHMTVMAKGKPVYVPLKPPKVTGPALSSADWVWCPEELASKFTPHTKAIIINNPNVPLGKVFQREELQTIADLCIKHDVLCISDEACEWLTYDGAQHIKIASFPGMWERTVTIGSAGKSFSATGWKLGWAIGAEHILKLLQNIHENSVNPCPTPTQLGWAIGAEHILKHLQNIHKNSVYLCPTPTQEAVAVCFQREYNMFGTEESYFKQLPKQLQAKRRRLASCMSRVGLQAVMPEGGYFMMMDISNLKVDLNNPNTKDELYDSRFVKWLIKEKGLGTIPVSAFFSLEQRVHFQNYISVCFVKDDSTLDVVEDIIKQWSDSIKKEYKTNSAESFA